MAECCTRMPVETTMEAGHVRLKELLCRWEELAGVGPQCNSRGKMALHCLAWMQETKKVVEEAGRKAILIPGDIASEEHVKCAIWMV